MITDEKDKIKIAENPEEALIHRAIDGTQSRIREQTLALELDKVILEYLKKKQKV